MADQRLKFRSAYTNPNPQQFLFESSQSDSTPGVTDYLPPQDRCWPLVMGTVSLVDIDGHTCNVRTLLNIIINDFQ